MDPLSRGELFKLADLMVMDYPDGRFWALYYAQSVSLTRFLVELRSPTEFIQFVQASQKNGVEPELRRIYKIDGFADLQRRWIEHAKSATSENVAVAESPAEETTKR